MTDTRIALQRPAGASATARLRGVVGQAALFVITTILFLVFFAPFAWLLSSSLTRAWAA